jgi:Rrf2 family protein
MAGIFNISEAASLAMHAVTFLAARNGRPHTTKEIAEALEVSEAHLSKVLQRLGKARLVVSVRGPRGGFSIGPAGDDATLLDVYECIEGTLPEYDCLLGSHACSGRGCIFGGFPATVTRQLRDYLRNTTVAALAHLWTEEASSPIRPEGVAAFARSKR